MSVEFIESNQVSIMGDIVSPFVFKCETHGTKFYKAKVNVRRNSGEIDILPLVISDELVDTSQEYTGQFVLINGQYRSYNQQDGDKRRLKLFIFGQGVELIGKEPDTAAANHIFLDGYICKEPLYRETPLGRRITDILLAVNRPYGESDYIPCICWGKGAELAAGLEVGAHVQIVGRIQSREYMKKLTETEAEKRIAYEVSVKSILLVNEEENTKK
nr:single-stranded DNA-binding protein [Sporofaciens musculi]